MYPDIHVWDAHTLETLVVLPTSHRGGVLHLAFSPDGDKLVSMAVDKTIRKLNLLIYKSPPSLINNIGSNY